MTELYQKISLDPLHSHAEILFVAESDESLFKEWSMGHVKQEHINSQSMNHLAPFLEVTAEHGKIDKGLIKAMLRKFINAQYRDLLV